MIKIINHHLKETDEDLKKLVEWLLTLKGE